MTRDVLQEKIAMHSNIERSFARKRRAAVERQCIKVEYNERVFKSISHAARCLDVSTNALRNGLKRGEFKGKKINKVS